MSRRRFGSRSRWFNDQIHWRNGRQGNVKGKRNEQRGLEILQSNKLPDWITSVRPASPEEDAAGKDIIVTTDKGDIGLQVKSGLTTFLEFKRKEHHDMIALVMIKSSYTDKEILKEMLKELAEVREALSKE